MIVVNTTNDCGREQAAVVLYLPRTGTGITQEPA